MPRRGAVKWRGTWRALALQVKGLAPRGAAIEKMAQSASMGTALAFARCHSAELSARAALRTGSATKGRTRTRSRRDHTALFRRFLVCLRRTVPPPGITSGQSDRRRVTECVPAPRSCKARVDRSLGKARQCSPVRCPNILALSVALRPHTSIAIISDRGAPGLFPHADDERFRGAQRST